MSEIALSGVWRSTLGKWLDLQGHCSLHADLSCFNGDVQFAN